MPHKVKKDIAVIGSGLAGLSAAYQLSKKYTVSLFDKAESNGMDVGSLSVKDCDGKEVRIDVPMRSINHGYYPTFGRFVKQLGCEVYDGQYETSWYRWTGNSSKLAENNSYFNFYRPKVFPWALIDFTCAPLFTLATTAEFLRFFLLSISHASTNTFHEIKGSLNEFLTTHHFSTSFKTEFLVPFLAAMGTCSHQDILGYPAQVVLHMTQTFGAQFYQIKGGVRDLCQRLTAPLKTTHFGVEIVGAWRNPKTGRILIQDKTGKRYETDSIVFALHASFASRILSAPVPSDLPYLTSLAPHHLKPLSEFEYRHVRVVVHTEETVLPLDRASWRGINIAVDDDATMGTLWVNYNKSLAKGMITT